ncbi:unnamed protein product [Arabis nemorensis]|uniref:Uncharacterized protein n=1 Tax=Arabis nemorensis TaxID=586526 RepID=A0A565B0U4_9BRAS|nr:unnamed protein product [Arabis nemorensis]
MNDLKDEENPRTRVGIDYGCGGSKIDVSTAKRVCGESASFLLFAFLECLTLCDGGKFILKEMVFSRAAFVRSSYLACVDTEKSSFAFLQAMRLKTFISNACGSNFTKIMSRFEKLWYLLEQR